MPEANTVVFISHPPIPYLRIVPAPLINRNFGVATK